MIQRSPAAASTSAKAVQVGWRSSGSLARARAMALSKGARFLRMEERAGGILRACWRMSWARSLLWKGSWPHSISKATMPSEYTSVRAETTAPGTPTPACSGAMYCGVPMASAAAGSALGAARPKSTRTGRPVSSSMTMLLGLTSRWTMPAWCTVSMPWAMRWRMVSDRCRGMVSPCSRCSTRMVRRVRPRTYSMAKKYERSWGPKA